MSNAVYVTLARQQGLAQEMQVVANNLANASTTGYRADRAIFAEWVLAVGKDHPSLSMGALAGHSFEPGNGSIKITGGQFDIAIQGEGFFSLETPRGERLTRAGHFLLSADGRLVDPDGNALLNRGGGAITLPESASKVTITEDGTIVADGAVLDRIGVVEPADMLVRDSSTQFVSAAGTRPSEGSRLVQGALEQSNVSPVLEVARMIEVQRAYEAGQILLEREDERIGQVISALRDR